MPVDAQNSEVVRVDCRDDGAVWVPLVLITCNPTNGKTCKTDKIRPPNVANQLLSGGFRVSRHTTASAIEPRPKLIGVVRPENEVVIAFGRA